MNLSMESKSSIIAAFILVSILAVGGVEFFCRSLGGALAVEKIVVQPAPTTASIALPVAKQQIPGPGKAGKPLATENYTIIIKRGLFGKVKSGKVPEKKPDPTPVALQQTTMNLTLLGTISGEGDVQRAIIFDKQGKTQDIYYRGDAIGAAIIKEVKRGEIILTVGGKDEILLMEELKSGTATESRRGAATGGQPTGSALFAPLSVPKSFVEAQKKGATEKRKSELRKPSKSTYRSFPPLNMSKFGKKDK